MRFRLFVMAAAVSVAMPVAAQDGQALLAKHGCTDCHSLQGGMGIPGWMQVSDKFKGNADAVADIIAAIKQGEHGNPMSMPPTPSIPRSDATAMANYIIGLAKK